MTHTAPDFTLAAAAICGFGAQVLRPGIPPGLLARAAAEGLAGAWPLAPGTPEGQAALASLARALDPLDAEAIAADNTRLFLGPADPVPVWESVWTTEEHLLYAPCEAEVRACYAASGFAPPCTNEPADHLSLELAFLAALLSRGEEDAARAFLAAHLGRWAAPCLGEIACRATTDFYRAIPALVAEALAVLAPGEA